MDSMKEFKVLQWYTHKLQEKFLYDPLTPTVLQHAQAYLDSIVREQQMIEKDPVWFRKVGVLVDMPTQTMTVGFV